MQRPIIFLAVVSKVAKTQCSIIAAYADREKTTTYRNMKVWVLRQLNLKGGLQGGVGVASSSVIPAAVDNLTASNISFQTTE